ncbi:MAG: bifunctional phosphopantothenoylcysteine decarboxylase/phosphopantothenate--cysteine ligase CoaBC [Bacteroidales bacterium]|jgi:phosphopantothenoylcysteine decarboxylase/phosphopantothenate--cysteine ligase|nr:bifunctional phosphopantothenoylcysteine decarboxylase/phosphopantothenate--cysteine ligase CoaBC [Bacteroidales bacterium]
MSLKDKKIIVGISGGIAAYKTLSLIRLLVSEGAQVRVICTQNALQFVTPLTIETLSQNDLYYDTFGPRQMSTEHVSYADWGDLFIVAPATANIIGKMAHGIADDALSTTLLAFRKQILIAPAMNVNMFENPVVQDNLSLLLNQGMTILDPEYGFLACGTVGKGRMLEPEILLEAIRNSLNSIMELEGKNVLVTAGATVESIDPVRFMSNHSSGKMGISIANVFAVKGAKVTLLLGKSHIHPSNSNITVIKTLSAEEMYKEALRLWKKTDIAILAAAVADYRPVKQSIQKIKKQADTMTLELERTPDILAALGEAKSRKQTLIGFALETDNETANARKKLNEKNADMIVLNSLKDKGAGFDTSTNKVSFITKNKSENFPLKQKEEVARDIVEWVIKRL